MANKKITELMAGTPTRDSLIESAIDISGTMDSRKVKAGVLADLNNVQIASEYDDTATYAYGDYRIKDGVLYRCTTAISVAEAWTSAHWTAVMVTGEYKRVRIMTKAQFDLLTNDEKDGFIYVSDYPTQIQDIDNVTLTTSDNNKLLGVSVVGSDISVGAVDNGCSFSESEMFVGEWINGKPLYKKVIKLLNKTIPSGAIQESISSLGATLAFFDHCIMKDNYGNYVSLPYISSTANTDISCYISANFGTLNITHGSYWENKVCDFYITILYTKT